MPPRAQARSEVTIGKPSSKDNQQERACDRGSNPPAAGRRRNSGERSDGGPVVGCQRILGHQAFFVQAEEVSHRANEAAIENSAGQVVPAFVFESFKEPYADAGVRRDFLDGHAAHFTFAF